MKKILQFSTILMVLLFMMNSFPLQASANPMGYDYLPIIIIKNNGNVEPVTEFIKQTGSVYTLTANLTQKYTLSIEASNIVFDGAGHSIDCANTNYFNPGIQISTATNVTIKNVSIASTNTRNIWLYCCSNCTISNASGDKYIFLVNCHDNLITKSNIFGIDFTSSNNNIILCNNLATVYSDDSHSDNFTQNNFLSGNLSLNGKKHFWDNGSIGNYWGDYLTKYSYASEVNNSGLGDVPYILDSNNIDHHPLIMPSNVFADTSVTPSLEATPEPVLYPQYLTAVAISFGIILASFSFFLLYKKWRHAGVS
ncbi:MAG: hypothetical protein NWE92_11080 [Candidatus Bathyarchaeota archaeon]|nr:hypothetical protein [Candidatus Bathyarchaeota archaeon]